jgi:hypothetical protein
VAGEFSPTLAPPPLLDRLAALGGAQSFEALEDKVRAVQAAVRTRFVEVVGPLGDGTQALRR